MWIVSNGRNSSSTPSLKQERSTLPESHQAPLLSSDSETLSRTLPVSERLAPWTSTTQITTMGDSTPPTAPPVQLTRQWLTQEGLLCYLPKWVSKTRAVNMEWRKENLLWRLKKWPLSVTVSIATMALYSKTNSTLKTIVLIDCSCYSRIIRSAPL